MLKSEQPPPTLWRIYRYSKTLSRSYKIIRLGENCMKKILSLWLVMGLSFVLVACGDSSDEKETDTSNEKTETEEVTKEEPAEVTEDGKEL